ncbi:putative glyoxalase superfamily protein PhnB [Flavobacterium arsenatis]|uniref:Glyoxalase superfamily protein PhnB n=1 Tax=Flavobacterium arsenatis TaxID=1484332 RepID=A0ABU1TNS2_9FLAO|nr:VOC family protein [Flavobacterium arsenatis]MDR6967604.1 putative glyoxalase superfamily protein PhnB [Flavobacterium arsenatis]
MKIPSNYLPVMPYLILNDSKGFLKFAKEVFNAHEQLLVPGENGQIMHGEIKIHDAVIMFAQASEQFPTKSAGMFIYVENVDHVYDTALRHQAISLTIPEEKEYGYTAGFEDIFGNQWWVVQG